MNDLTSDNATLTVNPWREQPGISSSAARNETYNSRGSSSSKSFESFLVLQSTTRILEIGWNDKVNVNELADGLITNRWIKFYVKKTLPARGFEPGPHV